MTEGPPSVRWHNKYEEKKKTKEKKKGRGEKIHLESSSLALCQQRKPAMVVEKKKEAKLQKPAVALALAFNSGMLYAACLKLAWFVVRGSAVGCGCAAAQMLCLMHMCMNVRVYVYGALHMLMLVLGC
jgi:hypothetical protein